MEAGFHAILQAWDYVVSNNQLSPILMSNYVLLIGINKTDDSSVRDVSEVVTAAIIEWTKYHWGHFWR